MKPNNFHALEIASQALAVTSQVIAIGIEIGIVVGGYYIYKKIKTEVVDGKKPDVVLIPDGMQLVPVEQKPTFKEKFEKVKKIFHAIVS